MNPLQWLRDWLFVVQIHLAESRAIRHSTPDNWLKVYALKLARMKGRGE